MRAASATSADAATERPLGNAKCMLLRGRLWDKRCESAGEIRSDAEDCAKSGLAGPVSLSDCRLTGRYWAKGADRVPWYQQVTAALYVRTARWLLWSVGDGKAAVS